MSRAWILSLLSCGLLGCQTLSPVAAPAATPVLQRQNVSRNSSLTGTFKLHAQVTSKYVQQPRNVWVYLPPSYTPTQRYPVLYMHDGNNLFDRSTAFGGSEWQVDENAERLIRAGQMRPVIIVGIGNTAARMSEYTWYPDQIDGKPQGGNGAAYGRFIVEELKPLIDRTYATRPEREHTAIMGSSLGGLISFYVGMQYPQVFGKVGMMSPSIWWKDRAILADVPRLERSTQVWVDMGTREGRQPEVGLQNAKDFAQALEKQGFEHFRNLAFHIEPGGEHNEQAWAARIERPLRFFFGQ
jgi:predicted alpha/beta superfamily hydrolase